MTAPNDGTGGAGLSESQLLGSGGQTPREDDAFEAGVANAITLVALSIANRLSTDRVDSVAMEYLNGFCSWLPREAETIREVVDLLAPDRVDNHDVCGFLDRNTDLTPQQVSILIAQIASLSDSNAVDSLLHHAGVPSREELLLLADYLEELAHNLLEQAVSVQTQPTSRQGDEPITMTSSTVGAAPEPNALAARKNGAPAPVGHRAPHGELATSIATPLGPAATRHIETAHQPGRIARHG